MKVAIFGVGGVGGYFGARLAASGADVAFVARGAHLAAMREHGLKVESRHGDLLIQPIRATDNTAEIGPVDIVLFSVKLYDVESAAEQLKPLLKPETAVISLQNGVDTEDRLAAAIGPGHVAGGVAYISATIDAPGVIRHLNQVHRLTFGELDGRQSQRLEAFAALCARASFDVEVTGDIRRALWDKVAFLAPMAAATALSRQSIGPILADPDLRRLFADLADEAASVARAEGFDLGPDSVEKRLKLAATMPGAMKASLAHDLEKGNRLELDGIIGALVRMGEARGLAMPAMRAAYAALKPFAGGRTP